MDWTLYFENVKDIDAFELALNYRSDYVQATPFCSLKYYIGNRDHMKLRYNKRTGDFFKVNTEDDFFLIDKFYLIRFLADFLNYKKLSRTNPQTHYVSFEFILNLYLSRDALSGLPQYNRNLNLLVNTVKKCTLNFEGKKEVSTVDELESYLKDIIFDFESLDSELKRY